MRPEDRFVPQAGLKIGRYRVGTLLGSGGAGSVYAAFEEDLQRPVAIKFVWTRRRGGSDARSLSLREARAASALDHPNIIMIHEVIETSETAAIVMELVKGVTLREAARRGPSLEEVFSWSASISASPWTRSLRNRAGRSSQVPLRYLAPERCLGQPPTQAGDVFALMCE